MPRDEDGVLQLVLFLCQVIEHRLISVDHAVEDEVGESVHAAGDGCRVFLNAVDRAADHRERLGVMGDEEGLSNEEIELAGAELVLAAERHRVHDEVEIVLIILDLGVTRVRKRILDRERVKGEYLLKDGPRFLRRGLCEVDPDEKTLVRADEAQGVRIEATANQFTVVKDKGVDHKKEVCAKSRS